MCWDDDDRDEPECDHEDAEIDILDGCARCHCGHSWYVTTAELEREHERIVAYDKWVAEQERPWNRFKEWLRAHWPRLPTWRKAREPDDGIPF